MTGQRRAFSLQLARSGTTRAMLLLTRILSRMLPGLSHGDVPRHFHSIFERTMTQWGRASRDQACRDQACRDQLDPLVRPGDETMWKQKLFGRLGIRYRSGVGIAPFPRPRAGASEPDRTCA
jgi:hypothetical protein